MDDNVGFLNSSCQKLLLGASHKRIDDGRVPTRVDDTDAQAGAVVVLRRGALERHCEEARVEMFRSYERV